jgi:hypothetical protein
MDLLDRRAANALGREVWVSIEAWVYQAQKGAGQPHVFSPSERDVAWGNDQGGGLRLKPADKLADWRVVWSTQAINRATTRLGNKALSLRLDWSGLTAPRREHLQANIDQLRTVGIKRELIRGQSQYYALLVLSGEPYRSLEYQAQLAERAEEPLGLDMGPTEQAWVCGTRSGVISLGEQALARLADESKKTRRVQRAITRSRRASNPECFDAKGRSIKGKRQKHQSKRGQRLTAELKESRRKGTAQRKQALIEQVRKAALLSSNVRVEDHKFTTWQHQYGKRMGLTSPGAFIARLTHEIERTGGLVERLPLASAYSQYCICGSKVKKARSVTVHCCQNPDCPIHGLVLNRHLFSAFLMSATQVSGHDALKDGSLATSLVQQYEGVPVLQESLFRLCGKGRGQVKHPEGSRSDRTQGVVGRIARKGRRKNTIKRSPPQPTRGLPDKPRERPQGAPGVSGITSSDAHGDTSLTDTHASGGVSLMLGTHPHSMWKLKPNHGQAHIHANRVPTDDAIERLANVALGASSNTRPAVLTMPGHWSIIIRQTRWGMV